MIRLKPTDRLIDVRPIRMRGRLRRLLSALVADRSNEAGILSERGTALIETAIGCIVYFSLFFGFIVFCMAFYAYTFVSDAAREATRYAAVRGASSCYANSSFPNCNLLPSNITSNTDPTQNPVLQFIDTMGYPGLSANNVSANVTYWVASQNGSGNTGWGTQCTGSTDANGNSCNALGNAVNVVVSYNYPVSIPFWKRTYLSLSSTSQMVINY